MTFNNCSISTVLENHSKAVEALLMKIGANQDAIEHALKLIKVGREYSISHFSPDMNYKLFESILKFQDNHEAMKVIMDWYRLQCVECYFSVLKEDPTLENGNRQKLFGLFAKHYLDLPFDNGHISSFVIGQRKVGLESLIAMEESMQKKVDSIRYEMEKEKARYKKLLDKMEDNSK